MRSPKLLLTTIAIALLSVSQINAQLVYHLPFSDGTNATLNNYGTLGGSGTLTRAQAYQPLPSPSTNVPTAIGDSHSYNLPASQENTPTGGVIVLPGSSNSFRMNTTGSQMTISTWINWRGSMGSGGSGTGSTISYIVGNMNGSQNAGWALGVGPSGMLRLQNSVGSITTSSNSPTLSINSWNHIALRYTAGAGGVEPTFYINGQELSRGGQGFFGALGAASTNTTRLSTIDGQYFALNGNLDDFAMWDTTLSGAKARALYTTPTLINGYDAGMMNSLFTAFDSRTNVTFGALNWTYATNISVVGRALGDTWESDGTYYTWLSGANEGMMAIPEPSTYVLMLAAGVFMYVYRSRIRRNRQS